METPHDPTLCTLLSASLTCSDLPPVIDAEQVATLLRCSKAHVEMLAQRGELPAARVGRGWIFVTAQLVHWLLGQCQQSASGATLARLEPAELDAKEVTTSVVQASTPEPEPKPVIARPRRGRGRPRNAVPDSIRLD